MKIAVEGCAHGELENIYDTIEYLENKEGFKVDLLICCGDFQSSRNEEDLRCMAVPEKYYNICSFYKYYTGEKTAPVLTIFIGGNHEASNYLQELPYGGWVAPNIYYLGYAGVINVAGLRIGGLSGIYKGKDYMKGHFEHAPYTNDSIRSVYHIRNLEVFRLKQISESMNIFLSHDWPRGVWDYGNKQQLIRFKPFFEDDINTGELGSKPTEELLNYLKPEYWFAAHLHCKFAALIPHSCGKSTKFLALDKCLPKRRFLQIVDIPHNSNLKIEISYDLEWLTILRLTNHLLSVRKVPNYLPGPTSQGRFSFTPNEAEKLETLQIFSNNLVVPKNFEKTALGYVKPDPEQTKNSYNKSFKQPEAVCNPQTVLFCKTLSIDDPLSLVSNLNLSNFSANTTEGATDISVDNQTFIDETDISANSPQKRLSLNLPAPITDNAEFVNEITEIVEEKSKLADNSINETKEEIEEDNGVNVTKKFKRRNAAFYQNDELIS